MAEWRPGRGGEQVPSRHWPRAMGWNWSPAWSIMCYLAQCAVRSRSKSEIIARMSEWGSYLTTDQHITSYIAATLPVSASQQLRTWVSKTRIKLWPDSNGKCRIAQLKGLECAKVGTLGTAQLPGIVSRQPVLTAGQPPAPEKWLLITLSQMSPFKWSESKISREIITGLQRSGEIRTKNYLSCHML